ncbi:MAG TPA: endonuclease domain-containing protein [Gammaproteobacteria bacterium]|nr:endonuclease domain-containing protein [Gammaproteobacteria bacterium]
MQNIKNLKSRARELRRQQTPWELMLWEQLRKRRLSNVRFLRQHTIGNYIVDFYAPSLRLAIELDGSQHFDPAVESYDLKRSEWLNLQGIKILRFTNLQVTQEMDAVLELIEHAVKQLLHSF